MTTGLFEHLLFSVYTNFVLFLTVFWGINILVTDGKDLGLSLTVYEI
jgi:hypothetical protein